MPSRVHKIVVLMYCMSLLENLNIYIVHFCKMLHFNQYLKNGHPRKASLAYLMHILLLLGFCVLTVIRQNVFFDVL